MKIGGDDAGLSGGEGETGLLAVGRVNISARLEKSPRRSRARTQRLTRLNNWINSELITVVS